jgi:uncharacterized membrane protein
VANVPLNNELDEAEPGSPESAAFWQRFLRQWTAWNNVRTVLGIVASALLVISLV